MLIFVNLTRNKYLLDVTLANTDVYLAGPHNVFIVVTPKASALFEPETVGSELHDANTQLYPCYFVLLLCYTYTAWFTIIIVASF
jgi:hypothetical protein